MRRAQHSVTGTEAVEILGLETFREEADTIAAQDLAGWRHGELLF
jgi:hypothetical protein